MAAKTSLSGTPLRFTRVKLKSWKNFKEVDVELTNRCFVIGANASGKSNFLEVFRFLHDLAAEGGGLAKSVNIREGLSKVRSLHATVNSAVEIEVEVQSESSRWAYRLAIEANKNADGAVRVKRERVTQDGKEILDRPDANDKGDPERLQQTALEQVSANKSFRELAEFFRSIRFMNLVPQLVREGQISPGVVPGFDPLGRDLLQQISDCRQGLRTRRLRIIEKYLRKVVPYFGELALEKDSQGRPHLEVRFEHWRPSPARQLESQMSDGTLRFIGILWALQEQSGPLLLEEPEWSLHTGIISKLPGVIARVIRASKGRQVLITTHSTTLLQDPGIAPPEILLVLPADKGGSKIVAGSSLPVIVRAMASGLTAAEVAYPHTQEQLSFDFPEAV